MSINKKDNTCIYCGLPPYPICPECKGFWNGRTRTTFREKVHMAKCILCGYEINEEEEAVIHEAWVKYKERLDKEDKLTKNQEANIRYDKLHELFMRSLGHEDARDLLALIRALEIARVEADG